MPVGRVPMVDHPAGPPEDPPAMSTGTAAPPAIDPNSAPTANPLSSPSLQRGPWRWMIVATLILGAAAGARLWQEGRFAREEARGIDVLPFDLETLPTVVGPYRSQEG